MPPTIERPVRERKSVERLVAAIDNEAVRELHIEKVFISIQLLLCLGGIEEKLFYVALLLEDLLLLCVLQGRGTALKDIPKGIYVDNFYCNHICKGVIVNQ